TFTARSLHDALPICRTSTANTGDGRPRSSTNTYPLSAIIRTTSSIVTVTSWSITVRMIHLAPLWYSRICIMQIPTSIHHHRNPRGSHRGHPSDTSPTAPPPPWATTTPPPTRATTRAIPSTTTPCRNTRTARPHTPTTTPTIPRYRSRLTLH